MLKRAFYLLAFSETSLLRYCFAWMSLGWAVLLLASPTFMAENEVLGRLASQPAWATLFVLHAAALLFGVVTRRFSLTLLLLEGVLGFSIWGAVAWSQLLHYGLPGPTLAGAIVALHLLLRYPTHYTWKRQVEAPGAG